VELMTTAELDLLSSTTCPKHGPVTFPTAAPTPPATTSSYYPYYPYYRTGAGQPIKKQAFIYQDPVTGSVLVTGTLTSTVTDTGLSMTFINTTSLNTRKATISVTYDFRKITDSLGATQRGSYTVSLATLRTADQ
jgi:hypothetical protein